MLKRLRWRAQWLIIPGILFVIFLKILFSQVSEQSQPIRPSILHKNNNVLGDNFAEHLNALTQRLQEVMSDYHTMQESHQQMMKSVEELKKDQREGSALSVARQMQRLKAEVESLSTQMMTLSNHGQEEKKIYAVASQYGSPLSFELLEDISLHQTPFHEVDALPRAVYTLPSGSTLAESVTMSALIGRIPVDGVVQSPYPFKIILGPENLISNGFVLPYIQGAIVQGYSVGDMTLSCVRGIVSELTFVFPDGRIVNKKSESTSLENLNQALGYLSEPDGNPCLPGTFYSNAISFLSGQVALGALSGAARGLAMAQQTTQRSPYGSEQYMNGDMAKLLLGSAGEEGASRVQAWWATRQKDSFDVVYIPSGRSVVINITRTLSIDDDPAARKLMYE